jgi:hypothetical protein
MSVTGWKCAPQTASISINDPGGRIKGATATELIDHPERLTASLGAVSGIERTALGPRAGR